jgi:putative selenate reductase
MELSPYPFHALVRRALRELESSDSLFGLSRKKFFLGHDKRDLSVDFHGRRASSALGPAAGPHSQLAQNIVLSFLGGARIIELKTVQILDELEIPRPCIDMETIGYNVEWSQELKLAASLEEYAKASMLIEILQQSGHLPLQPGFDRVIYDMSVGYDLKGIKSPAVMAFIEGMKDSTAVVERLKGQIPAEYAQYRDLDFNTQLADTLTLSTFHGCPPDEIEQIIAYLIRDVGLNCVAKLNPTLLGEDEVNRLLHQVMGYDEVQVPSSAFEKDATWKQAVGIVERLRDLAQKSGRSFGVKFTNTLIVKNHREFFPSEEKEMYLSGPPLHVLAMNLVRKFRQVFGSTIPISFSAGINKGNFADAVALGLRPITVCSDLLKPGGYGRLQGYSTALLKRMEELDTSSIDAYVISAHGQAKEALATLEISPEQKREAESAMDAGGTLDVLDVGLLRRWAEAASLLNTEMYVEQATADTRYHRGQNAKVPKKVGSHLELFDCLTCDKCIPVCPNDANFALPMAAEQIPIIKAKHHEGAWQLTQKGAMDLDKKHQIANFADFCNECGNCDIFCPEDGGPYLIKPRFFGSEAQWRLYPQRDGFFVSSADGGFGVFGRIGGVDYRLEVVDEGARYWGDDFELSFNIKDLDAPVTGHGIGEVDLTYALIMERLARSVLHGGAINYVNCLS